MVPAGLPAIATNVGGLPEILDTDYLIDPYNLKLLSSKIEDFINSQQLRYVAGKLNYNKAKSYDKNLLKKRRDEF